MDDRVQALLAALQDERNVLQQELHGFKILARVQLAQSVWDQLVIAIQKHSIRIEHIDYAINALNGLANSEFGKPRATIDQARLNDIEGTARGIKELLSKFTHVIGLGIFERLLSMADAAITGLGLIGHKVDIGEARQIKITSVTKEEWERA